MLLIISLIMLYGFTSTSSGTTYSLFQIGRSRDSNVIKYDVNLTSEGKINTEKPIKFYWIKNTDGAKVESLTYTQEKLAYGIKYLSKKSDEVKFQFVSYSKRTFILKKVNDDKFKVITYINKKGVEVKKIFVQFGGGTFNLPKVNYVKMYWRDSTKGTEGTETIKP